VTEEEPVNTRDVIEELMAASATAFEDARGDAETLAEHRVLAVDVHVPTIVLAVAMSAPRIEEIVAASSARIPETFDLVNVIRLRTFAAAAWHAHAQATGVNPKLMRETFAEAVSCREALLHWAQGLAEHGWIRKEPLAGIGRHNDACALAYDVIGLAALLSTTWPRSAALGLQVWHLARATALGLELLLAQSARSRVEESAYRMRARTFSVVVWAYDECRQLIRQLRHDEGDHDDIAPSIGVPARPDDDDQDLAMSPDDTHRGPTRRCVSN
jgi:hypothetical protein